MNDLRFNRHHKIFQANMSVHQSAMFRNFELEENCLFKADNKEYVHFFFLFEGEIRIGGIRSTKSVIMPNEFFFIPNAKFVCRALKDSKFILVSINRFHYQANKDLYEDIMPVVAMLKHRYSPIIAPPILSVFIENLAKLLTDANDPLLQNIKQQELFYLLRSLYSVGNDNEAPMYGRLSLS
ncbi:MAG: hypothetical protein LBH58_01340 [Tannerellaceae bacterium]|jgi:hypothetical protein|nr:hypothetical protein [Tannerellaceae bacterium]